MTMIKYRVWDNIQQKYIDNRDVSIDGNGILTVVGIEGKYHMSVQPPNDLAPRFIIEQYTGLKDKNGVEIAVGDILMDDTGQPVEYWPVSFSDGSFISECAEVFEPLSELTILEVIGNVHENAELLEESI